MVAVKFIPKWEPPLTFPGQGLIARSFLIRNIRSYPSGLFRANAITRSCKVKIQCGSCDGNGGWIINVNVDVIRGPWAILEIAGFVLDHSISDSALACFAKTKLA